MSDGATLQKNDDEVQACIPILTPSPPQSQVTLELQLVAFSQTGLNIDPEFEETNYRRKPFTNPKLVL